MWGNVQRVLLSVLILSFIISCGEDTGQPQYTATGPNLNKIPVAVQASESPFKRNSVYPSEMKTFSDGSLLISSFNNQCPNKNGCRFHSALLKLKANGAIDSSFGADGWLFAEFGHKFQLDASDRILVAGQDYNEENADKATLRRYLPNGTVDPTFGVAGTLSVDFGIENERISEFVIENDGTIRAAFLSAWSGTYENAIYQTNIYSFKASADGVLDTTYGVAGIRKEVGPALPVRGYELLRATDGSYLAYAGLGVESSSNGVVIISINADFTLNSSFGGSGFTVAEFINSGKILDAIAVNDGSFVIFMNLGSADDNCTVVRLLPTGQIDYSFGDAAGFSMVKVKGGGLTQMSDGSFLAIGSTDDNRTHLFKYKSDGKFDYSFGDKGFISQTYTYETPSRLHFDRTSSRLFLMGTKRSTDLLREEPITIRAFDANFSNLWITLSIPKFQK